MHSKSFRPAPRSAPRSVVWTLCLRYPMGGAGAARGVVRAPGAAVSRPGHERRRDHAHLRHLRRLPDDKRAIPTSTPARDVQPAPVEVTRKFSRSPTWTRTAIRPSTTGGSGATRWCGTATIPTTRCAAGSLLYAIEIPFGGGGNTLFNNQYLAYRTLPVELKETIEGLHQVHDSSRNSAGVLRPGLSAPERPEDIRGPSHPLVRVHPHTGRRALYLGRRRAWPSSYVEGLSNDRAKRCSMRCGRTRQGRSWRGEHTCEREGDACCGQPVRYARLPQTHDRSVRARRR